MKSSVKYVLVGCLVAVTAAAAAVTASASEQKAAISSHNVPAAAATSSHNVPAAAATSSHGGTQVAAKEAAAPASSGHGGPTWGYTAANGPARWASMSRDYELCGAGAMQSPIDLSRFAGASVEPIDFDYKLSPLEIIHNGHTVQVNYTPGSGITVEGKRFELLQAHFHTPSEHSVGGRRSPMEMHLVHKSASGELAVIGVLLEVGEENLALREFWGAMPSQAGPARAEARVLINPRDLLPKNTGYYRYMGSLTTPPCSEGVNWFVMRQTVTVSVAQIERFAAAVGNNARPTQATNRRFVLAPLAGQ